MSIFREPKKHCFDFQTLPMLKISRDSDAYSPILKCIDVSQFDFNENLFDEKHYDAPKFVPHIPINDSFNYNFEDGSKFRTEPRERRYIKVQKLTLKYDSDVDIPTEPIFINISKQEILDKNYCCPIIQKLFSEHPILRYTNVMMNDDVIKGNYSTETIRHAVSMYGYYVSVGPWAKTFVKYGYDPRKNKKNVLYQTLTNIKVNRESEDTFHHDSTIPNVREYVTTRLIDIKNEKVVKIIKENTLNKICSTGWLKQEVLNKIVELIK
ncbi:hypothetical protein A3Q56_04341 [Intoshia linei]|uniref:Transcription factor IIIC subunit 5 HTH domain-containing protein n=1 Tax=Intoshia linei TaxID=1819745 RepID=A0A177B1D3_9BILA|nr:hypothetical protein A3Q56_04341 [Intoshia linei]